MHAHAAASEWNVRASSRTREAEIGAGRASSGRRPREELIGVVPR